jgi:hypothetical protein
MVSASSMDVSRELRRAQNQDVFGFGMVFREYLFNYVLDIKKLLIISMSDSVGRGKGAAQGG